MSSTTGTGFPNKKAASGGTGITSINSDVAAAQTLTGQANKILISDVTPDHAFSLGTDVVTIDQANKYEDFNQTFLDNRLRIERPAGGDVVYTIVAAAIAANRNVILPLLTGDDTLVTEAFAQTLTNKTMDGDLNTFIDINETQMNVSVGAASTVLTSNGVGLAPTYQAPAGGEFTAAWTADHNQGGSTFSLRDAKFSDQADPTKEVHLNLTGNTTGIVLTIATLQSTAQTVQIPNTTALDQFVLEDFIQTLTNKTIAAGSNTISGLVIGSEVTGASTALSDTGDIAYLNQANTFGAFDNIFEDGRFQLSNPAGTFQYVFQTSALITIDKNVTLPLLTADDTLAFEAFAQTLTNKTMTAAANTFSGFAIGSEVSGASTDLTDTGVIVRTNQTNTFGDFAQIFLDNQLQIERPAGGGVVYNFLAAAIAANRTITLPLLTTGDTMVTEAFTQTLTNKTIDGDLNTILDIGETMMNVEVGGAGTVLTSNGVGVAPTYQTPGGGEFTGAWTADHNQGGSGFSLRDARFSDPTDSTKEVTMDISGNTTGIVLTIATLQSTAQTLQIPNTTGLDQFVLEDFAQTLTNKTITAAANTLTIASTDLTDTGVIVRTDQTNTFGAFAQIFPSSQLQLERPAGGGVVYQFVAAAIAANRTITLPLLTTGDTMATLAFAQTFTNKSIDLGTNTLTGSVAEFNAALQSETFAYIGVANAWGTVNQNIAATGQWQEGGVPISPIGRHDIPISAGAAEPTTTAGAGAKATREIGSGGNQKMVTYIPFTNNVDTNCTFQIVGLPRNYNNSSFEVVFCWTSTVAPGATDTVRWVAKAVSLASGDLISTAYGTEAGTDHTPGAESIDDVFISAAVTITPGNTPGDGDFMFINVEREGLNAADDFAQIVQLVGIIVRPVLDAAVAA